MKYKYKNVDTRTIKGLKKAEALKKSGWKVLTVGVNSILFERVKVKDRGYLNELDRQTLA